MFDHIIYFSSLALCIALGKYYKKIDNTDVKKIYGTGLGILVCCLVCGHYFYHSILIIWGNIIIVKCCDKSYIHQMSIAYNWIYLLYLHLNVNNAIYVIWIHQILALRLVGISFEMRDIEKNQTNQKPTSSLKANMDNDDKTYTDPTAVDIIAYSYFFIGLHRGPYYKWKIFNDHFSTPFGTMSECRIITEQKLLKGCFCALAYGLMRLRYSPKIYYDDEFYRSYNADFRYLSNIPLLLMYCLQWQIIMTLCTSVATEAGFGVYPVKCQALPGFGPSTQFSLVKLAAVSPEVAMQQEYNFAMLKCYDKEKLLLGPKMNDTLRSWNMPTRYWFWSNIYKNLGKCNREMRSALSFAAWTIWIGPSLSQFIISTTLWIHLHLEADYSKMYHTDEMKLPWNIGFSIMRVLCLIYLTPCFILGDTLLILKYYNSIFWVYHIVLLVLITGAFVINKSRLRECN